MTTYIIRRLLLMIPTLIGITAVTFFVMGLSPGGVGGSLLNEFGEMEAEKAKALKEYYNRRYGLDKPLIVQYGRWLNQISPLGFRTEDTPEGMKFGSFGFKWPDLGKSFSKGRSVVELYKEALPVTLLLNVVTTPIIYFIAIITGIYSARHRGKLLDVGSGVLLLGTWSIPTIWSGVMLIGFFASREYWYWFPSAGLSSTLAQSMPFLPTWSDAGFVPGWLLDRCWHLVLPVACLTYGGFAFLSKLMRSAMLENLSADFVRTARAKGLSERVVLWRHAFRNSLLPLITMAANIVPGLLAGSVIVESIFSIPGMGLLTIDAIHARDRELVLAGALVAGILSMVSILIADLCYVLADPRVSYE
ncbi:MAG: ABC transporter permease subunit [Planctomycetes bacterium]|nr:ABC transporter permease subunit [Planctomycetota bacterium]